MGHASLAVILAGVLLGTSAAYAQENWWRRSYQFEARLATPDSFDGDFHYCRVMYRRHPYGAGGGWATDYSAADVNLSIRLSELTKAPVSRDASNHPNHLIVRITDDELFSCPFIMMQEVGAFYVDDEEARQLREYLLKGGFLWVDDFWGRYAWQVWEHEIRKVLPASEYPIVDLPADHPIFRVLFELPNGVPQVPSINFFFGSGGRTSERGADSADVHVRGIFDRRGNLMVLMTHNTDVSDSWEREGEDPRYFYEFSVAGYAVGLNVLLYAMTH